jgi:hypothetical protein
MYSREVVDGGIAQRPNRLRTSHRACNALEFLIANPRLKFSLTHSKFSLLKISNRERIAIFLRRSGHLKISLATSHSSLVTEFLIETPRLEIIASARKQRPANSLNRDKTRLLRPPWRCDAFSSAFCSRIFSVTLCLRGQTLTLREPQSNLAASCFVRARVGEYSQ